MKTTSAVSLMLQKIWSLLERVYTLCMSGFQEILDGYMLVHVWDVYDT